MVGVLTDKNFSYSIWGQKLLLSLTEALRAKRIAFCELSDVCPADCQTVFIIASDYEWTRSSIRQLNKAGRFPILLCNQAQPLPGCVYSCVCSDINASMKNVIDTLHSRGKNRVALYGVNNNSIADISRVNSLFAWREDFFDTMEEFDNRGSLEKCFDEFYSRINDFDAVICANDFAAISLVRRLKKLNPSSLEALTVISCAETKLAEYYRDNITTLNINIEQYGKAALYIYNSIISKKYISSMTLNVAWSLDTDKAQARPCSVDIEPAKESDAFYSDPELREMLVADKLLNGATATDRKIIDGLIKGNSQEQIAEACFMSVSSIKYRLKRLQNLSGAESKEEITDILKRYI